MHSQPRGLTDCFSSKHHEHASSYSFQFFCFFYFSSLRNCLISVSWLSSTTLCHLSGSALNDQHRCRRLCCIKSRGPLCPVLQRTIILAQCRRTSETAIVSKQPLFTLVTNSATSQRSLMPTQSILICNSGFFFTRAGAGTGAEGFVKMPGIPAAPQQV